MSAFTKAKTVLRRIAPVLEKREQRTRGALYVPSLSNFDYHRHIAEARDWLSRAQDSGADRGVSYGAPFGKGFLPSYPETTGYIICTFVDLAQHFNDERYLRRAVEMSDWEAEIQLNCGAVMGGMYNENPSPAVFNTGMVLLGWAKLMTAHRTARVAQAARRAGEWLLEMQDPDGSWIRGNSKFADASATVYNVKAAWGLAEIGVALEEEAYVAAAVRNAEYAVSKQLENGWFSDCCLDDRDRPLLHTIGYAMQGLIGIGKVTRRADFIHAAERTADSLLTLLRSDGFIPGRIARDFSGSAEWCCLTGTAQTSVVWSELERLTGKGEYGRAADLSNAYLMSHHDITSTDPCMRGGLPGSWPVWGPYGTYTILNWATKFFVDALLLRPTSRFAATVPC